MKRTISIILAVLMLVSMIPLSAIAETDYLFYIMDTGSYIKFDKLDVSDGDGSRTVPQNDPEIRVTSNCDVSFTLCFNNDVYEVNSTNGWEFNGTDAFTIVKTSGQGGGSEELQMPALKTKTSKDCYMVTVQGDNYTNFFIWEFSGGKRAFLQSGDSFPATPDMGYYVHAYYDPEKYEVVDSGGIWGPPHDPGYLHSGGMKAGEAGGSTIITAPTLSEKEPKDETETFTLTVNGDNYTGVEVVDYTAKEKYQFNPGESCEVIPGNEMDISVYYDNSVYEILDRGDWKNFGTYVYCEIYAGNAGESITLNAPTLTKKPDPFYITVQGENYTSISIHTENYGSYDVTPGQPCGVRDNEKVTVYANFNAEVYEIKDCGDDWWVSDGATWHDFTTGNSGESITIPAPVLVSKIDPLKDYRAAAKAEIDKYYADCGMVLDEIDTIVEAYKKDVDDAETKEEIDGYVATAKEQIDNVVANNTQYEISLIEAPVLGGEKGSYSWKSFYINDGGQRVDLSSGTNEVTFEQWYLRTAFQRRYDDNGAMTIRFISFLDGNFESYDKAGFIMKNVKTFETTEVYEELSVENRMVDVSLMGISDYAFVVTASFDASEYDDQHIMNEVTVTPFVVKDGVTYKGETYYDYLYNIYHQRFIYPYDL